jgi:Putative phage serine protease XkdF
MAVLMRDDAAAVLVLGEGWRFRALAKALEGEGDRALLKEAVADDAHALSEDEPAPSAEPACPKCGRILGSPGAIFRHQMATGHDSGRPDRDDTNHYAHGEVEKAASDVQLGVVQKATKSEQRYTLSPLYLPNTLDAHGEFATADDLQEAAWDYFRNGDRKLRKQHGSKVIGEVVEMMAWPHDHVAKLTGAGGYVRKQKLPAGTVYCGIVWSREAWSDVKAGRITGLSMGGSTVRVKGVAAP